MDFCIDGNAMDCDTLDQWSGIELLRVFLLKIFFKFFNHPYTIEEWYTELMIMASHQTFSGQLWHLTDQIKFDLTNLLYIINGNL